MRKKIIQIILFVLLFTWTAVMGLFYFDAQGKPYENGRYFDEANAVVYLEQTVFVYRVIFYGSLLLSLLVLWFLLAKKKGASVETRPRI